MVVEPTCPGYHVSPASFVEHSEKLIAVLCFVEVDGVMSSLQANHFVVLQLEDRLLLSQCQRFQCEDDATCFVSQVRVDPLAAVCSPVAEASLITSGAIEWGSED